jgi:hypothetical protein
MLLLFKNHRLDTAQKPQFDFLWLLNVLLLSLVPGVQKLVEVYKNKPDFADAEAQEDTRQRLHQVWEINVRVSVSVCACMCGGVCVLYVHVG